MAHSATAPANSAVPTPTAVGRNHSRARPPTPASTRSTGPAGPTPGSQPPAAIVNATTPITEATSANVTRPQPPEPSSPAPAGVSTNAIGTRYAGSAYRSVCHIVGITLPPVIADAATAARDVGGVASDSTAK